MAAFRLTGRGRRRFCTAVQTDGEIRAVFAVTSADFGLLRISLMSSFSLLPLIANSICFTPCYAAVLIWPVSISSCVVRLLSVVCISLSCCAAVISMLGLRTALCCAVDFVCCLCTAASACAFDPRVPVLPVLRFLLSYGCCLICIRCCMGLPWPPSLLRPMAARRFLYAVLRGCLWRRVSCGMAWRWECEDAPRRGGSLP